MKIIEVVAGVIEKDNKILCTQRNKGKFEYVSLKWEFPGGKIEPNESKEQALTREIKEELDLDIFDLTYFETSHFKYPDFIINLYCYKCRAKSLILKLNVHKDYIWLEKEKLDMLDWAPADKPIVDKIMKN